MKHGHGIGYGKLRSRIFIRINTKLKWFVLQKIQKYNQAATMKMERLSIYAKVGLGTFGIYIMWIIAHYAAAHAYIYTCVPATIRGFLLSPFIAPAPHCYALRWVIQMGGNSISAMWIILGLWIASYMRPVQVAQT